MATVRAAITQTTWTGDKASMLDKHEQFARDAEAAGRPGDLLPGAVLRPLLRHHRGRRSTTTYAEPADGPIVQRFAALAAELSMVMVLPIYEEEQPGVYYNTAVVVDADGTILGKYRKHHIPNLDKFWEKFYFRPGNLGYPVFKTAVGPIGVYICYDRHFPEGWRELGLNGAQIVFNPNATKPGLSNRLWEIEQPAAAAANGYFVAAPNRVGTRGQRVRRPGGDLLRLQPVRRPAGQPGRAAGQQGDRGGGDPRPRPGHDPDRSATPGSSTATGAPTPTSPSPSHDRTLLGNCRQTAVPGPDIRNLWQFSRSGGGAS